MLFTILYISVYYHINFSNHAFGASCIYAKEIVTTKGHSELQLNGVAVLFLFGRTFHIKIRAVKGLLLKSSWIRYGAVFLWESCYLVSYEAPEWILGLSSRVDPRRKNWNEKKTRTTT